MSIITKKGKITHMDKIKNRKVVEANDLITSIAKMDKNPLKIFELAVSCIDTANPPKDNVVYLSKKELFSFFDVSDSDKHSRFKKTIEKMQEQAFFEIREEIDKGLKFRRIVPIPEVAWNDYNDEVYIRFDQAIMPYLIDLKTNFTQYALIDVMELESKYSIILYKWFCMNYNQFEHYTFKSNRTKKQLDEYQNPIISMPDLRLMTNTEKSYKNFPMFNKRVVENAVIEINKNTHFNVSYEPIRTGRTVTQIQFHIEKKENWKDEDYKKDNSASLLSIEQREREDDHIYSSTMSNPYTISLMTKGLLVPADMGDRQAIIGLSKHVYPLYDTIVKDYGKNKLETHLDYISSKMIGYDDNKRNIVKYLKTCADQFLELGGTN